MNDLTLSENMIVFEHLQIVQAFRTQGIGSQPKTIRQHFLALMKSNFLAMFNTPELSLPGT
jgi:hypothetical protein